MSWDFWIDAGGTFTDCIGRSPEGRLHTCKVLSTGVYRGVADHAKGSRLICPQLRGFPADFFTGYRISFLGADEKTYRVVSSDPGELTLQAPPPGLRYELSSGEEAPIVGIRQLLGLPLSEKLPELSLCLGTTRGTNALLERKGAEVAFMVTRGFSDLVEIGTQARPHLFDLNIIKPNPLYKKVVELDERMDAEGFVIRECDWVQVRDDLRRVKKEGIDTVAVCCLNAYKNPFVEREVKKIAEEEGMTHISLSTTLSPTIKALDRAETAIVDAYLSPVLGDYIRSIHRLMGRSPFKMITSAGGLTDAHKFVGKDSLLSGPAGGVVGFAHVAREAGFEKSIGFDMGGTSTDVSRFDGKYEYQFSLKKAGVRLVSPMYAIETVAAGGGSICRCDGQKLTVGPESAGADPGPACYGRGGPLTVTDINVFNGKIDESHFPIPLDRQAIVDRLKAMQKKIGGTLALEEIAEGLTQVANLKMANAIKTISTAKGYDPSEYVLVSFGGAGAQHACAIASQLGMRQVLLHPLAGILSAYGVGMADVKRFAEESVLKPFTSDEFHRLDFSKLEKRLREEIIHEGIPKGKIKAPIRMLDLRYQGEDAVITVRGSSFEEFRQQFCALHKQLYGHDLENRPIEIAAMRVELAGETEKPKWKRNRAASDRLGPASRSCLFHGQNHETLVFQRSDLEGGESIQGPAIICEPYSTIVIDPGWSGQVAENGDLILTLESTEEMVDRSVQRDPVRLEIFSNQFTHIATQMGVTLQKASLSTNVKERLDFSCGILDRDGRLVVNAPHIPVHLGALGDCVQSLLESVEEIRPGDVFLSNDPCLGGSHLPDLTVMTPVFMDERLCFFTASRAHHAEIGGKYPGSFYPFASSLEEEGVIFRHMRIVREGYFDEQNLRSALTTAPYPSRLPDENIADIRAAIAANHKGEESLRQLVAIYSWDVVHSYMGYLCETAEEKTREAIEKLADGEYGYQDRMDDGSLICLKISKKGSEMTLDFTGSGPVHPQSLNANAAIVQSAVLYGLRCMLHEDIPLNAGVLKPIRLMIPEGMLNPPQSINAAVAGGNVEVSQRVVDVFFGALKIVAASQGTMNNVVFGNDRFSYYETICGGSGAGPGFDGASAVQCHMTNTRMTDPEVLEQRYPVRLEVFQIRKGSGGRGTFSGGDGVIRKIRFLEPVECSLMTSRRTTSPFGLEGAAPGDSGKNYLLKADGSRLTLDPLAQIAINSGEVLEIHTPGGGGYQKQSGF